MNKNTLTSEQLRIELNYDAATGVFVWARRKKGIQAGDVAGAIQNLNRRSDRKYRVIRIDRKGYLAHRLAWLYMTGRWPEKDIDHRNGDGLDNRWSNLREATRGQNNANARRRNDNTTGYKGVLFVKGPGRVKRWMARIHLLEKRHVGLGFYATAEEAARAYDKAARQHFGKFARLNFTEPT